MHLIASDLLKIKDVLWQETNRSITEHMELLNAWEPIIGTAKTISQTKQIQNMLNDTILT